MPARLTFTTPIGVPNIRYVDSVGRITVDPDAGELQVPLAVSLQGGLPYFTATVTIKNGTAEGIRAKASPTGAGDCAEVFSTSSGVATAFNDCRDAFNTGGRAALLTAMKAAGLLPAGAVT
jgi:hypothetical protein